jgi:hypothetical protein
LIDVPVDEWEVVNLLIVDSRPSVAFAEFTSGSSLVTDTVSHASPTLKGRSR